MSGGHHLICTQVVDGAKDGRQLCETTPESKEYNNNLVELDWPQRKPL